MNTRIAPFATARSQRRLRPALARLRERFSTLSAAHRRHGLAGAAVVVLGALPGTAVGAEWFALLETGCACAASAGAPAVTVRWGGRDDIGLLTALGRTLAEIEERLDAGDRVCLALRDGQLVGYFWFRADSWREEDVEFTIPHGELWGYDAYVAPQARGRGIHPRMATWAAEQLARNGVPRYLSGIDYVNAPSLRSAATRGARQVGSILVMRVLGLAVLRERWGEARPAWRVYRRHRGTTVAIPAAGGAAG